MNYKKIAGIVSFIIGLILLIYGFYGSYRMSEAKKNVDDSTYIIPKSPIKSMLKGTAYSKINEYKGLVILLFVGGAFFIVVGGGLIYLGKAKKR